MKIVKYYYHRGKLQGLLRAAGPQAAPAERPGLGRINNAIHNTFSPGKFIAKVLPEELAC